MIPALRHWAVRLNPAKFEIFPTNDGTSGEFSRAIAMPYGPTWDVLPEQAAIGPHGGSALLDHAFFRIQRLTAEDLPKPQESKPQESRKIPMALQAAIDSMGPYPIDPIEGKRHRSPVTASIIWQLRDLGFDADTIETTVEGRGPFVRYEEANRSLSGDIARIIKSYDLRHPNKAPHAPPLQIQSSAEFITNFTPPDYLIDGLIQRRFIYSMTGPTGEGKTSVALLLALLVDRGWPLDGRDVPGALVRRTSGSL